MTASWRNASPVITAISHRSGDYYRDLYSGSGGIYRDLSSESESESGVGTRDATKPRTEFSVRGVVIPHIIEGNLRVAVLLAEGHHHVEEGLVVHTVHAGLAEDDRLRLCDE